MASAVRLLKSELRLVHVHTRTRTILYSLCSTRFHCACAKHDYVIIINFAKKHTHTPKKKKINQIFPNKFYGVAMSHKGEPRLWVESEDVCDSISADTPLHHLGYHVLQNMGIAVTSIADLDVCVCVCVRACVRVCACACVYKKSVYSGTPLEGHH